jgi:hypothetical protein
MMMMPPNKNSAGLTPPNLFNTQAFWISIFDAYFHSAVELITGS